MRRSLSYLIACVCCTAVWLVAADMFDVKPGLWETTTVSESSGRPPIPPEALARLSPEQRAQLEERLKSNQTASGKPIVTKRCVTKEDLSKAMVFGDKKENCTQKLVSSSRTKQEIQYECTNGAYKSTGTVHIEALNSENVQGSFQFAMSGNGNTMNSKSTFTSKWLGSDCGSVGK